jgi:hypothetical protein
MFGFRTRRKLSADRDRSLKSHFFGTLAAIVLIDEGIIR